MSDQPKDEPKHESKAVSCPKCSGYMLECRTITNKEVSLIPANYVSIYTSKKSAIKAMMCEACGYTEFYALNPEKLQTQVRPPQL